MFREQVGTVSAWFDRWTPCEQTVAMVALLRRLHPTQARFVASVLQKQLSDCGELRRAEILANDSSFVASLANSDSKEGLIRDLLTYLPLLNPKNSDVKNLYLALIPKVLKYTMDNCAFMEEARQLLSYSLIHPAFNAEDRGLFSTLLQQFEDKLNNPGHQMSEGMNPYPSSLSGSPPTMQDYGSLWHSGSSPPNANSGNLSKSPGSQAGLSINNFGGSNFQRIRRSNSLTPPVLHSDNWHTQDDTFPSGKPRSLSLSSEVSPQSSLASSGSGSESHLDDPRSSFCAPGMREVPGWLKSLRLHKYSFLFAHMTFDEMMNLSEEMLETQGVTKGARHKIILSIKKLKDRAHRLQQIHDEMASDRDAMKGALNELKWMLATPIKPCYTTSGDQNDNERGTITTDNKSGSGGGGPNNQMESTTENTQGQTGKEEQVGDKENESEVTTWVIRVIGKACESNPDMECENLLASIIDKCLSHEAFSQKQKSVLSHWRQQQAPMTRRGSHPHFHGHHHRMHHNSGGNGNGKHGSKHFNPRILNYGTQSATATPDMSTAQSQWNPMGTSIQAMFMSKRPSLQDSILEAARLHSTVQRTKSAPLPNFFSLSSSPPLGMMSDLPQHPSQHTDIFAHLNFMSEKPSMNPQEPPGMETGGVPISGSNNASNTSTMDITSRLESLCLSMTEAALGPAFNSY